MAMAKYDLVVGIDVGTTGTGVAYHNSKDRVAVVEWRPTHENQKVPTVVARAANKSLLWGFDCEALLDAGDYSDYSDYSVNQYFKLEFDQPEADEEAVCEAYRDFLRCLYEKLATYFTTRVLGGKNWATARTLFLFSTPATWSYAACGNFMSLVREAGFGSLSSHHLYESLKEPQAVILYYQSNMKRAVASTKQETILVVDVGGGTADLCLVRVNPADGGKSTVDELSPVSGRDIGSVHIDRSFEILAKQQLSDVEPHKRDAIASRIGRNDFIKAKTKFCSSIAASEGWKFLTQGQSVKLSGVEMQRLFDDQLKKLKLAILEMMFVADSHLTGPKPKPIDRVIFSGGLSNSEYAQRVMTEFVQGCEHLLLRGASLETLQKPELAVCIGLALFGRDHALFQSHMAQASFGLRCQIPFRRLAPGKWGHLAKAASREPTKSKDRFGQAWIEGCVDWLVRTGDSIRQGDRIRRSFFASFDPDSEEAERLVLARIMTSRDKDPAPFVDQGDTQMHAVLRIDLRNLSKDSLAEKGKRVWSLGGKHRIEAEFVIEAEVGFSEAKFQCLDPKTHEPLSKSVIVKATGPDLPEEGVAVVANESELQARG